MDKKNSVLIVDDDTTNLKQLAHILRSEYTIYTAIDGASALEIAEESLPDLILLDVIMSGLNGFEVLAKLKLSDITKAIPVIFITGVSDVGNESKGFDRAYWCRLTVYLVTCLPYIRFLNRKK